LIFAAAAPRPARSLAARNAWLLAALLPGIALQCWRGDANLLPRLALALSAALLFEALALRARRQPLRPYLVEGSALSCACLIVLWLPALDGWQLLLSIFIALVPARQLFGGLGANLFHPVMAGVACAQLLLAVPVTAARPDPWLATAWLCGGLLLLALRITRWQAPLGLITGAALGLAAIGASPVLLLDPRWFLAAGFVLTDPVTSSEVGRARLLGGFATGAICALAGRDSMAALPFAILAMNALAPALDSWLSPRREMGTRP
jgi:electron transport complex protein RnfD